MKNKSLFVITLLFLAGLVGSLVLVPVTKADTFEVNQSDECSVTISPATATVDCGNEILFVATTTGTACEVPDYAWSVTSSIGSTITQNGLYTAGANDAGQPITDTITVTDSANGNITARATVIISDCCCAVCPPLTVEPSEGTRDQAIKIKLTAAEDIFRHIDKKDITVEFGTGITVNKITDKGKNYLKVEITIDANAVIGTRTVFITTPQDCAEGDFVVEGDPSIILHPLLGKKGETMEDVRITGSLTHFAQGKTTVKFDKEITVKQVTVADANTITMKIKINENAEIGIHDVIVTTDLGGGNEEVVTASFMVLPE